MKKYLCPFDPSMIVPPAVITMKKIEARHLRSMSPLEMGELLGLSFSEDEASAFSDSMLLAQQYLKYRSDYVFGKKALRNSDEERWYRRFLYDMLQRPKLLSFLDAPYLNKIRSVVAELEGLGLAFPLECLWVDSLYDKTIEAIAAKPVTSFYDLTFFVGECDDAVATSLEQKIRAVPEHDASYVVME